MEAVEFDRLSSLPREKLCRNVQNTELSFPNECEGSKKDFSLRSKQGFLAESILSTVEGPERTIGISWIPTQSATEET